MSRTSHRYSPIDYLTTLALCLSLLQAIPIKHTAMPTREVSILPPLLQTQSLRNIFSSVVNHLLWPLMSLCPLSQGSRQILMVYSVFFLLLTPSTIPKPHPSSLLSARSQDLRTHSTWYSEWPYILGYQNSSSGNTQSPHPPKKERRLQKSRIKASTQQRQNQIGTPRIIILSIPYAQMPV